MKIERQDFRWRVLAMDHVVHDCLENLAMVQGYRVASVCQELGVTEQYLRRLFLRDVGLTPKEWMQRERMVVARRLLVWGYDPLDVSDVLGFSDGSCFRREFRAVYGVTPWRFLEIRVPEHS